MNIWENFERIGLVVTIVGFAILGWFSWRQQSVATQLLYRLTVMENRLNAVSNFLPSINNQQLAISNQSCDVICIRKLVNEAVASVSGITKPQKDQVVERVVEKVQTVSGNSPKTQYVSLGAGETTSTDWVTLPGAEVTFNINDFGKVTV